MTDWPAALKPEGPELERTHRAYVREPTDRTHSAYLAARAAFVEKAKVLMIEMFHLGRGSDRPDTQEQKEARELADTLLGETERQR